MNDLNIISIRNIRKGNFSWDIDFEKAEHSTSGSMMFNGSVDFKIKKFNGQLESQDMIFGHCKIDTHILDMSGENDDKMGQFKVDYHIEIEPGEELLLNIENDPKNMEDEVKKFIMYLLEPYFRYDFETVMYDAGLPKNILPYGMLHKFISD